MKSPVVLLVVLAFGLSAGYAIGLRARSEAAHDALASTEPASPAPLDQRGEPSSGAEGATLAGETDIRGGATVQALLAGFNRKTPIESNLRLMQKILAASPKELEKIVREMSGLPRDDFAWDLAKRAATQRWVEVAPDEALALAKKAPHPGMELHEASAIFRALTEIDPDRAWNEAKSIKLPGTQNQAMYTVLQTVAQSDPRRALQLSEAMPGPFRIGVMRAVYDSWASRDPVAAAADVLQIKNGGDRQNILDSVMRHFGERDPVGAMAWVQRIPEAPARLEALQRLFGQLGYRDPQQALALVANLPRHQQIEMQKSLVVGWARTDPEAASAWILSRTNTFEQQQMIRVAASALLWMDPGRASEVVSKLAPGPARDHALQDLFNDWTRSDATAAQAFLRSLPEVEQQRLHVSMAHALIRSDPEQALAYLKNHPIDDPAHGVAGGLARAIADQSSPEKALEWAQGLQDEPSRQQALPEIFSRMAAQDPAKAAEQALRFPASSSREESLVRIGGVWARNDFDDALAWARGLTGKDRESALGAVLTQGAPYQPTTAAAQYAEMLAAVESDEKPADSFVNAAGTIAGAYFAEDQTKAAAWVTALPQEDARAVAARSLAEQWAQYDAPAASEWIGTLPEGKPRDQAVGSLVNRIAASDPAMAFVWAATMDDAGTRDASLETAFQSWRKLDADAARTAVSTTDWPDDEKGRWLEKLR